MLVIVNCWIAFLILSSSTDGLTIICSNSGAHHFANSDTHRAAYIFTHRSAFADAHGCADSDAHHYANSGADPDAFAGAHGCADTTPTAMPTAEPTMSTEAIVGVTAGKQKSCFVTSQFVAFR